MIDSLALRDIQSCYNFRRSGRQRGEHLRQHHRQPRARGPRLPADELHGGQPDEVPVDPGDGAAEEEPEDTEEGDVNPEEEKKIKKRIQK